MARANKCVNGFRNIWSNPGRSKVLNNLDNSQCYLKAAASGEVVLLLSLDEYVV